MLSTFIALAHCIIVVSLVPLRSFSIILKAGKSLDEANIHRKLTYYKVCNNYYIIHSVDYKNRRKNSIFNFRMI